MKSRPARENESQATESNRGNKICVFSKAIGRPPQFNEAVQAVLASDFKSTGHFLGVGPHALCTSPDDQLMRDVISTQAVAT